MTAGKRFCTVCGKEKELRHIKYANIYAYIECECEKNLREETEKKNNAFALRTAFELRNRNSRLPPLNQNASFKTLTVDKDNEKAVKAGEYILKFLLTGNNEAKKNSLVLQGNRGSGKTYIASAIINDFNSTMPVNEINLRRIIAERDNGFSKKDFSALFSPCKFITEMDLFALYYDDFNYCKTDGPLEEFRKAQKLLVIDDVGASGYDKHRIQAMYLNIIDHRQSYRLPVVFTTNLTKKELCDYLGERAFDRLQSCCYFIDLTSENSRR